MLLFEKTIETIQLGSYNRAKTPVELRQMCATVREVLASDHDSVLEISRHIWEGYDYLPFVIDEWLEDFNCHVYGVEVNHKIVAIANIRIIENGRIGWMEGLRVHPDYRGKGFADMLTKQVMRKGEELNVQGFRYTTSTENEASLKMAEKYGFARTLEMGVFWHPRQKDIHLSADHPPIEESTPEEVYSLLKDKPNLIPNGILVHDWKASESSLENFRVMGKSHKFYIAQNKAKINSLSCACQRRRSDRSLWVFTIYAEDQHGILSHLNHNKTVSSKEDCDALICTYPTKFERILKEKGIISNEQWSTHLVLLEKTLQF